MDYCINLLFPLKTCLEHLDLVWILINYVMSEVKGVSWNWSISSTVASKTISFRWTTCLMSVQILVSSACMRLVRASKVENTVITVHCRITQRWEKWGGGTGRGKEGTLQWYIYRWSAISLLIMYMRLLTLVNIFLAIRLNITTNALLSAERSSAAVKRVHP